ncbi:MAG: amidohydrolase family protein [Opitutales bacterium]
MLIDSHQHFLEDRPETYPWMGPGLEPLMRAFGPEDLAAATQDLGLSGSILIQARQTLEETAWLQTIAARQPRILGVVGWLPLRDATLSAVLDRFVQGGKAVGVRHVVHDEPDDRFILDPAFNDGLDQIAAHGLVYDLLLQPRHLEPARECVQQHPDLSFVLDHGAKPSIAGSAPDPSWVAGIRTLAEAPNVACKVSGLVTEATQDPCKPDTLRPWFDTLVDAFGPRRLLFGSDWPVCLLRGSYRQWFDCVQGWTCDWTPGDREALFGLNAARIYLKAA